MSRIAKIVTAHDDMFMCRLPSYHRAWDRFVQDLEFNLKCSLNSSSVLELELSLNLQIL